MKDVCIVKKAIGGGVAPTAEDVDRYKQLRSVGQRFHSKLVKTVPRKTIDTIGTAIGMMHDGVLYFDTEDMSSVLMDCCLYDWVEDGKNLIQHYSETYTLPQDSDEAVFLAAMLQARYRILMADAPIGDAAIHCIDLLSQEELVVIDLGLNQTVRTFGRITLATRVKPFGEFWVTGGTALPVDKDTGQCIIQCLVDEGLFPDEITGRSADEHRMALTIVRWCLDAGMGEKVEYLDPGEKSQRVLSLVPQPSPTKRLPSRNAPCPCGSGRKYKGCCGREKG